MPLCQMKSRRAHGGLNQWQLNPCQNLPGTGTVEAWARLQAAAKLNKVYNRK